MYIVKAGNTTIHDLLLDDRQTVLFSPVLVKEVNKADSFKFTIYPNNPGYNSITRLTPGLIEVYDDGTQIFRGRVLNITKGWQNQITAVCESDFAMLNDTIVRPYSFTGTVLEYLTALITQHNSQVPAAKQFSVGSCQVTGTIYRAAETYPSTMGEINDKLLKELGGYIMVRRSGSTNYIDYLTDSSKTCGQTITFGENLLNLSQVLNGEDIVTGLIPLGAKDEDTGERLTIKSVNNNIDYIEDNTAVALYGKVYKTITYDDITTASTLLAVAQADLAALTATTNCIELTAADLHLVDRSIDDIGFFEYVTLNDSAHSLSASFLCTKKQIDLASAANCQVTLGLNRTVSSSARSAQTKAIAVQTVNDYGVTNAVMTSAIKAATDLITGVDGGYIKYHYDSNGQPTEMLIMNASTETAATKIWRWNVNGLGYSNDGGQTYALAMTANGAIVADFIVAGILQSVNGNYSLDLATGAAVLKDATITGGSIQIVTDDGTRDVISLTYSYSSYGYPRTDGIGINPLGIIQRATWTDLYSGNNRVLLSELTPSEIVLEDVNGNTTYIGQYDPEYIWLTKAGSNQGARYQYDLAKLTDSSGNYILVKPGTLEYYDSNDNLLASYDADEAKVIGSNGNYVKLLPGNLQYFDSNDTLLTEYPATGYANAVTSLASEEVLNPTSGDSFAYSSGLSLAAGKYIIIAQAENGGNYSYSRGRIALQLGYSNVRNNSFYFNGAPSDATMEAVYFADLSYQTTAKVGVWVADHAGKWNVSIDAIKIG